MLRIMILAAILLTSIGAQASNFGIGISIEGSDNHVYIPYMLNDDWILEGSFYYSKRTYDYDEFLTRFEEREFGIGLLRKYTLKEKSFSYYGLRASYVKSSRSTFLDFASFGLMLVVDFREGSFASADGYSLEHTFGIAYEVTDNFSIAAEVAWKYMDLESKQTSLGEAILTPLQDSNSTETRLALRYFF